MPGSQGGRIASDFPQIEATEVQHIWCLPCSHRGEAIRSEATAVATAVSCCLQVYGQEWAFYRTPNPTSCGVCAAGLISRIRKFRLYFRMQICLSFCRQKFETTPSSSTCLQAGACHLRRSRFGRWVFPKIGVPQNGWFIMENPIKMDDLGVPLFLETPRCCQFFFCSF